MIKGKNIISLLTSLLILLLIIGCKNNKDQKAIELEHEKSEHKPKNIVQNECINNINDYKVVFIEIGSVKCIPCKKMQPIMKQIENEYANVKVVFYDIRKPEGRQYAKKYRIRFIPTQVFLNEKGIEYFRHEGFFPKNEIEKVLAKGGVKAMEK